MPYSDSQTVWQETAVQASHAELSGDEPGLLFLTCPVYQALPFSQTTSLPAALA